MTYCFFRSPYDWGAFRVDIDRFARLIKGNIAKPPSRLVTNPTVKDIDALEAEGLHIACDIETTSRNKSEPWTGLDPTQARLRTIGLGNINWGLSIEWSKCQPRLARRLQTLFSRVRTVWHNGPWYDHRILARYGFRFCEWDDTRDARRALSSTSRLSLAYLASIYDDCRPWKEGEAGDAKGLVFTNKMEDLKRYNAQDCVETARVWKGICDESDWKTERVQTLYKTHKEMSVLAGEMHTNGFRIDFRERARLKRELYELFKEREAALLSYVNLPKFRCNANSMRSLLFKRHATADVRRFNLDDPVGKGRFTKTGLIAVDLPNLLLTIVDPFATPELKKTVDLYWAAASAWKARSTYVTSLKVDHAVGRDKRCRPGWNSCGTDTGRWSCSDPNIQNLSAKDRNTDIRGALPDVRRMYRAGTGRVLIHADYSQLELRVRAIIMEDTQLQRDLESGDVYSANAKDWFGLPLEWDLKQRIKEGDTKAKSARFTSKTVHLASQYGAGDAKVFQVCLKEDRAIKFQIVRGAHSGFKRRYDATVKYWFAEQARVMKCGYSETLILRRRRLYPRPPDLTETANYPTQGTAADIITLALLELRSKIRKIHKGKILTHEHDAITAEVPKKFERQGLELLQEVMERPFEINGAKYVFPTECKAGVRWSEV